MRNCPLTRQALAILGVVIWTSACAKDPILQAAESMKEEVAAGAPGAAGAAEEMTPGVPDEPTPGIPGQPMAPGEVPSEGTAEDPSPGVPEAPTPGVPEQPEPAAAGAEDRPEPPPAGDGAVAEPEPGVPDEPEPAPPGSPGGAHHKGKEGEPTEDGPHVTLRGSVGGEGATGKIRVDLFDGDQRNVSGPRPKVVGVHELASAGSFEVSIPVSAGRVWVGAYADINGNNRPDKGEPFGWYSRNPVHMGDVSKPIDITLEVEGKSSGLGLDFGE